MPDLLPLPYKDFNIKARIKDREILVPILQQLHATFMGTDTQTDWYFKTPRGKLKLRQGHIENLITHYERMTEVGVERTVVYRYDLNPTPDQVAELRRGYELIGVIAKERQIYMIENIKIHLDLLPNGDEFLEIEAIDRENKFSNSELKAQCIELQLKLGIAQGDILPTGYLADELT